MPKVVIIILNWNGWQDTIECLKSLNKVDYDNFEVVVVDNGSTNNSTQKINDFVKSFKFKFSPFGRSPARRQVSVFSFRENKGFAGGVNAVLRKFPMPDSKYILLLNNDTTVNSDFLTELIKVVESDEKIGIAGPMIYFYDKPDYINSAGNTVNWLMNKGEYIGYNDKDAGQFGDKPYEVDYISGACLLVKKEVIDKIGLMPEEYFLYYEDTDWNFRAKKAGYKSILIPAAKIWHKESASAKKIGAKYVYYHVRNGILFNKKYAPFYKKILIHSYNLYVFAKQLVKLHIPSKKEWAKAALAGITDYYNGNLGKKE